MKQMAASSIDIVVTSPPYNLGIDYHRYDDRRPRQEYLDWLLKVGNAIKRVLKPDGSFFLNIGSTNADPWISLEVAAAMRQMFALQNHILWIKSVSIGEDTVGHFKPISSYRYLNQNHEAIFHFTHEGIVPVDRLSIGVPFKDKTNITRRGHAQDKRCAGNVWFIPYRTVQSKSQKFNHPAGFPEGLPERCIKMHGVPNAVVMDPFLGAGTTLVAAARQNCSGIGIDIDDVYVETAIRRLKAETAVN
ncbi:MAG: DNA-methyltransferase [Caulobacteraceae bacterium]